MSNLTRATAPNKYFETVGLFVHRAIAAPFTKPKGLTRRGLDEKNKPVTLESFLVDYWERSIQTLAVAMERFIDGNPRQLELLADQGGEEWSKLVDTYRALGTQVDGEKWQELMIVDMERTANEVMCELVKLAKGQQWSWVHCEVPITSYRGRTYPSIKRMDLIANATRAHHFEQNSWNPGLQIIDQKTGRSIPMEREDRDTRRQLVAYRERLLSLHKKEIKDAEITALYVETLADPQSRIYRIEP